jgi:hypothetical protein
MQDSDVLDPLGYILVACRDPVVALAAAVRRDGQYARLDGLLGGLW